MTTIQNTDPFGNGEFKTRDSLKKAMHAVDAEPAGGVATDLSNLCQNMPPYPSKGDILREAMGAVAVRGEAYDGAEDNFARIARYWNAHLTNRFGDASADCWLNPTDVAQMMILMKMARLDFRQDHRDSWVDAAGYSACGGETSQAK